MKQAADISDEQLRRTYRQLAKRQHPDKNPNDPKAAEAFQATSEAYQVLADPNLRARYGTLDRVHRGV